MSRGLSKMQHVILAFLETKGPLTTPELAELIAGTKLYPQHHTGPNQQQNILHAVRRACHSLLNRDMVTGKYTHADPPRGKVASWTIVKGA
jgi:hypothetical protein